jgi:hypothetical protein
MFSSHPVTECILAVINQWYGISLSVGSGHQPYASTLFAGADSMRRFIGPVVLLAVLSIAGSIAWSIFHPARAAEKAVTSLVALRRVNADAAVLPLNSNVAISPFAMNRHRSASISNFDAGSSQPWHVGLAYQECPRTRAGAIRLTVFVNKGLHTERTQYSRTVVDRKSSDSATYAFPGKANTEFVYQVDVPSAHGCQAWSIAGETN